MKDRTTQTGEQSNSAVHLTGIFHEMGCKLCNDRYVRLGKIVLKAAGAEACQSGYGTTDPEWVGRYALMYGDINRDGTLN